MSFDLTLTLGSVLNILTIASAAFGIYYGFKYRLTAVEGMVRGATMELHGMREALIVVATQAVRIEAMEREIERLRAREERAKA